MGLRKNCRVTVVLAALAMGLIGISQGKLIAQEPFAYEQKIKDLVEPYLAAKKFRGISVGIVLKDQTRFYDFGLTGSGQASPSRRTIYEIGSISKVFTSLLLADAVVQEKAKLDQQLGSLIEGLEESSPDVASITLKHLSNHQSGLPRLPGNLLSVASNDPFANYGREQLHEFLFETVTRHDPGTHHQYSNLGAGLLGDVLAQQAKLNYGQLLKQRIATPLKMSSTMLEVPDSELSRFAKPHVKSLDPGYRWKFDALAGAGAIRSNTEDMVKFIEANLKPPQGDLGKAINLAFEQHLAAAQGHRAMGLGWMIAGDGSTRWHNGQTGGYEAMMLVNRKLNAGVVLLCNTAGAGTNPLAEDIFRTIIGMDIKPKDFGEQE